VFLKLLEDKHAKPADKPAAALGSAPPRLLTQS
jgi:hypothetical protein